MTIDPPMEAALAATCQAMDDIADGNAPSHAATAFALLEAVGDQPPQTRLYTVATQAAARLLIDGGAATREARP